MSGSTNKVILVGNLGKDPEIRTFANGGRVASFSLATSESWKDKKTGEQKEKTEWHRIAVTGKAFLETAETLKKGDQVSLEGKLETRKWTDKEGIDHYATEIIVRPVYGVLTLLNSPAASRPKVETEPAASYVLA